MKEGSDGTPPAGARARSPRTVLLESIARETAALLPGVARLGGRIVGALYLAESPRSIDDLATEIGCSKSTVFTKLRLLEDARIVERRREPGVRHDVHALRSAYPEVILDAYLAELRRMVQDKQADCRRARRGSPGAPMPIGPFSDPGARRFPLTGATTPCVRVGTSGRSGGAERERKLPKLGHDDLLAGTLGACGGGAHRRRLRRSTLVRCRRNVRGLLPIASRSWSPSW
jgi:DNA-binding transcriptional ArsR family regulator